MTAPALRLLEPEANKAEEPAEEPGLALTEWLSAEHLAGKHAGKNAGRLIELSAPSRGPGACMSIATVLLQRAQREGETVAWIQPASGSLYPPDLQQSGIDLDALVVVHIPSAQGSAGLGRAAEILLRSGAFGLVAIDLGSTLVQAQAAWLGRLLGLARQHESRVLFLTDKNSHADSLGPLISIRVEPNRTSGTPASGTPFVVQHNVLKNKSGTHMRVADDRFIGPHGTH